MSTAVLDRPVAADKVGAGIIDSDIHPAPAQGGETLKPYMARRWQDHLDLYGQQTNGPYASVYGYPRYMPGTARRDAWPENGGLPGSDLSLMRAQHLDRNNVALGIMEPLGFGQSAHNVEFGAAMVSAVNDWQVDAFVDQEPRLRASLVIAHEDARAAVAEIRRRAPDRRYAQIQLVSLAAEP